MVMIMMMAMNNEDGHGHDHDDDDLYDYYCYYCCYYYYYYYAQPQTVQDPPSSSPLLAADALQPLRSPRAISKHALGFGISDAGFTIRAHFVELRFLSRFRPMATGHQSIVSVPCSAGPLRIDRGHRGSGPGCRPQAASWVI